MKSSRGSLPKRLLEVGPVAACFHRAHCSELSCSFDEDILSFRPERAVGQPQNMTGCRPPLRRHGRKLKT